MKIRLLVYGLLLALVAVLPYAHYKATLKTIEYQIMCENKYLDGVAATVATEVKAQRMDPFSGAMIGFGIALTKLVMELQWQQIESAKIPYKTMFMYFYFNKVVR